MASPINRRKEIVEAAAKGVQEYLQSIRGANACGAGAIVEVKLDKELTVRMKDGEVYATFFEI